MSSLFEKNGSDVLENCQQLIRARHQNPAWLLMSSRRAPLLLSCLKPLFDFYQNEINLVDAEQQLAEILEVHANEDEYEIKAKSFLLQAKQELKNWIKRGLIVERNGNLSATDSLQQALQFIDGLQNRTMTSTASRLSTVQREVDNLENAINPDAKERQKYIQKKINALQKELENTKSGFIDVFDERRTAEAIKEVYLLAMSLRADFSRVEDSYRAADKQLRQSVISEQQHRGEIIDKLLDSHDNLLQTDEGQVFHVFHKQLSENNKLNIMQSQIRKILAHPVSKIALNNRQSSELRWLYSLLVKESKNVINTRAKSERDVRGFLQTGLASEHHRVGELLKRIFLVAQNVDWQKQKTRRLTSSLPPAKISVSNLPLIKRLRYKTKEKDAADLNLEHKSVDFNDINSEFWAAFDVLDKGILLHETIGVLSEKNKAMTIKELAEYLPPEHDLETLSMWLEIARSSKAEFSKETESLDIKLDNKSWRFIIPKVELSAEKINAVDWDY